LIGRFGLPLKRGTNPTAITEALDFFAQRNVRNWLPYNISLAATLTLLKVAVPGIAYVWHHTAVCVATSIFSPHD
jgi:hypothetical protein